MKSHKVLYFIVIVFGLLALLSLIFPSEGITIGSTTLRFPSLHSILVRDDEPDIEDLLQQEEVERQLSEFSDSVAYYRSWADSSALRFWFPNDNPAFFDKLFASMETAQEKGRTLRILHYGDSQIEMDRMSSQLRSYLQGLFGGGGPGLLPFNQPIASLTVSQSTDGSITMLSTYGDSLAHKSNGNYGPMARCYRVSGSATASIKSSQYKEVDDRAKRFTRFTLLFNNRPGPISAKLSNGDGYSEKQTSSSEGVQSLVWNLDSAASSLTLSVNGTADIYGMMVDDGPGVAVDNIALRGCSGQQFTKIDPDQLTEAYKHMDVGLIILQFGGNSVPYLKGEKSLSTYCTNLGKQIDLLHKACPKAQILFIGPSDMSTKVDGTMASYPYLPTIVDSLRVMALEHGAAYWSIYHAMGGRNSMAVWHKNGLACADQIHFTNKGVKIMGGYLVDAFDRMYELYRFRQRVPRQQFDSIWRAKQ